MGGFWTRDTLPWALAAVAVALNAALGSYNVNRMRRSEREVQVTRETQAELAALLANMTDAETGHRGYLLTGRPQYLEPYFAAERAVWPRVERLRHRVAHRPDQLAHLADAERLCRDKFGEMVRTCVVLRVAGPKAAAAVVADGRGKRVMDDLREVVRRMRVAEDEQLVARGREADAQYGVAETINLLGAGIAVVVVGAAALLTRREMRRRLRLNRSLAAAKAEADDALGRLDAFLRNAPSGMAILDDHLRYVRVNDVFARTNGRSGESHLGRPPADILPDFPRELLVEFRRVLAANRPLLGQVVYGPGGILEVTAFPVPLADGRRGLGLIGVDVTDRQLAEERLRESESRFRQLAETMPQIVWVARADGYREYFNARWREYTGQTPEQSLGRDGWAAALHPDDQERGRAAWARAVEAGGVYEIEYRFRRTDGQYRWFLGRANPVRNAAGEVIRWLGTCTDIDEHKRQAEWLERRVAERTGELLTANTDLVRATGALKASNEELEKFAYVASHDLQEPLRKIQAFGTRLADAYRDALGDKGKDYLARMLDSAGRMRRLIDDLLLLSRVGNKSPWTGVDLNAVLRDVLEDLDDGLRRAGGRAEVGDLPAVDGDPAQLGQVFQNLIGNALKFARPGVPPVVRVWAEAADRLPAAADPPPAPGSRWRITVADNGIGFEPQYADRIFELFQRLHGRQQYEGTGLGLAIVRKILHRHGAVITARGTPGAGAAFVIDWPAHVAPPD